MALFIRKNRELAFTEVGQRYWQQVHTSLENLDAATTELQHGQNLLTISVMPPLERSLVIPNLASFQEWMARAQSLSACCFSRHGVAGLARASTREAALCNARSWRSSP